MGSNPLRDGVQGCHVQGRMCEQIANETQGDIFGVSGEESTALSSLGHLGTGTALPLPIGWGLSMWPALQESREGTRSPDKLLDQASPEVTSLLFKAITVLMV